MDVSRDEAETNAARMSGVGERALRAPVSRGRVAALVGLAAGGLLVVQATPASAFLDFLFGSPQQAAPPPVSHPLDVRVDPSRRAAARARLNRRKAEKKVAKENGERRPAGRHQVQRAIDPVAHPDWYLNDPNIRYGDILILKSGPVVYTGRSRSRSREDFVSLGQAGIVSGSNVREIRMMVSGVWTPPDKSAVKKARRKRR